MDPISVFTNKVRESNTTFIEKLRERVNAEEISFLNDSDPKYGYVFFWVDVPANANGIYLLKIFVAIVTRQEYNMANFQRLKFGIRFINSDCPMTLLCTANENHPGNGLLIKYKKYDEFAIADMKGFDNYFRKFLREALTPPSQQAFQTDDYWKLSVLMIFEIARRIPAGDKFHNVPIAAGILMAMDMGDFAQSDLSLFKGENRDGVFKEIAKRYYNHQLEMRRTGTSANTNHDKEIKEDFNKLMAIYNDPQAQSEVTQNKDIDELSRKLSETTVGDSRAQPPVVPAQNCSVQSLGAPAQNYQPQPQTPGAAAQNDQPQAQIPGPHPGYGQGYP